MSSFLRPSRVHHSSAAVVGVGIAIVLVAGGGKLAIPTASADPAPVADLQPAVLQPVDVGLGALPPSPSPLATIPPTIPVAAPSAAPLPGAFATAASRSLARQPVAPTPPQPAATSRASSAAAPVSNGDPRSIARSMLAARGWSGQFSCLDSLWSRESGWRTTASNPSGAYGIPQALPGSKMASAGSDWRTNPATQITWGLDYISSSYGSPCAAWSRSQSHGSY